MRNNHYINTDKITNFEIRDEINAYLNERTPYPCELYMFGIPVNYKQEFLLLKVYAPNGDIFLNLMDFNCGYTDGYKCRFKDYDIFNIYQNAWIDFMRNLFKDDKYDKNFKKYHENRFSLEIVVDPNNLN